MAANNIEKLNTTNYANLCNNIKYVLIENGLGDITVIYFLNIETEYKRIIAHCTNTVEAWKKLTFKFLSRFKIVSHEIIY